MASVIQTRALILHHSDHREHDRLLTVLSPELGKIQVRARGSKKGISKLGGSLEPVTEVDLTIANGRQLDVVTGSIILERWPQLRQDVVGLVAAQWLLELIEKVTKPNQPEPELYQQLKNMLSAIQAEAGQSEGRRWIQLLRRAWNILQHEGFVAESRICSRCHRMIEPGQHAFDPLHGWLHRREAGPHAQSVSAAAVDFLNGQPAQDDPKKIFHVTHRLVQSVIEQTLDQPLRSERVLQKVMRVSKLSASE